MQLSGKGYTFQSAWMQKDFEKEGCNQSSDWSSHIPLNVFQLNEIKRLQRLIGVLMQKQRTSFGFARSFAITKIFKGQGKVDRGTNKMFLQSMLN